jgi:hypothetical protein
MTPNEYQSLSHRDYPVFVAHLFAKRSQGVDGLLHAAIGIIGEVIELERATSYDNLVEEAGDIEFYLEAGRQVIQARPLTAVAVAPNTLVDLFPYLRQHAAEILDHAKKAWVYNKLAGPQALAWHFLSISAGLDVLAELLDVPRDTFASANMTKLRKRYPNGYTDAAAQARADKEASA